MKRSGILHPGIAHLLASCGHTDYFLVTDRGFPVPPEPERIDLALVDDLPTVLDVLRAVHAEFTIDRIVVAEEMEWFSPERVAELRALLGDVPIEAVSHIELKRLRRDAKATIRTGDTTPLRQPHRRLGIASWSSHTSCRGTRSLRRRPMRCSGHGTASGASPGAGRST